MQAYCRGYVIIADEEDIGLKHAMLLTPSLLKQHMVVFQVGSSHSSALCTVVN